MTPASLVCCYCATAVLLAGILPASASATAATRDWAAWRSAALAKARSNPSGRLPLLACACLCLPLIACACFCLPLLAFACLCLLCLPLLALLAYACLCLPLLAFACLCLPLLAFASVAAGSGVGVFGRRLEVTCLLLLVRRLWGL